MAQNEKKMLEEGNYTLYIYDAEEKLGKTSFYIRVGLSRSKSSKPICWLYIGSGPQAKLVWGRKLGEYGKRAGLPRSCYADDTKIVDFMYVLKSIGIPLNVLVKHRRMGEQMGLDVQLKS